MASCGRCSIVEVYSVLANGAGTAGGGECTTAAGTVASVVEEVVVKGGGSARIEEADDAEGTA